MYKQTALIEFLFLKKESVANSHKRLMNVDGNTALNENIIKRRVNKNSERKDKLTLVKRPPSWQASCFCE